MRIVLILIAALTLAVAPAHAKQVTFAPEDDGQVSFVMPSGNIGCIYTPEGGTDFYEPADGGPELSCDRIEPSYRTVILTPWEEPDVIKNPGEQGCCGASNVFKYGNFVALDGFVCVSRTSGLSCETEDGEHGFTIAKAGITTY